MNFEEITDVDYMHGKRVYKDFEIKRLGEYHNLYLNSDTLLLADVFENFRKICLEIYNKKRKLQKLIKMISKAGQLYLAKSNLLIAQDLWQFYYQILLMISQKKSIKLNVKIVIVFLNIKVLRRI